MREIEIKLKVANFNDLRTRLSESGCKLEEPIEQHDIIFGTRSSAGQEWIKPQEGDIVIRIRKEKDGAKFTLKQQKSHELDNIEYEIQIGDPDDFNKMLELMGWVPVVEVKKKRQKGKLGEYNVCLDEVEQLGTFVELEKLADDDAEILDIEENLFKTMEKLGVSRSAQVKNGYDTLIYKLDHV